MVQTKTISLYSAKELQELPGNAFEQEHHDYLSSGFNDFEHIRSLCRVAKMLADEPDPIKIFSIESYRHRCPGLEVTSILYYDSKQSPRVSKLMITVFDALNEVLNDCNETIRISLEREYEYICSAEYFLEVSEANEWLYNERGQLK